MDYRSTVGRLTAFTIKAKKMATPMCCRVAKYGDRFRPYIQTRKYRNFVVYYSRGTSLIDRIRTGALYEPEMSQCLAADLSKSNAPTFIDVGANIGLVTLNALADVPNVQVYAFEPGIHQYQLLYRTVEANKISAQVCLCNAALGREVGYLPFAVHTTCHASGDGFLDTGRAGEVAYVTAFVQTLDSWWKQANCPHIDVIKIDTEGAELWVLEGAGELLLECKPTVYLEIWPENLGSYPYDAHDILRWLNTCGYSLQTLTGVTVTLANIADVLGIHETFVAKRGEGTPLTHHGA